MQINQGEALRKYNWLDKFFLHMDSQYQILLLFSK